MYIRTTPVHLLNRGIKIYPHYDSLSAILLKEEALGRIIEYIVSEAADKKTALSCEILRKGKFGYDLFVADCSWYIAKDKVRCLNLELNVMEMYMLTEARLQGQPPGQENVLRVEIIEPKFEKTLELSKGKSKFADVRSEYWRADALKGSLLYAAEAQK